MNALMAGVSFGDVLAGRLRSGGADDASAWVTVRRWTPRFLAISRLERPNSWSLRIISNSSTLRILFSLSSSRRQLEC